MRRLTAVVQIVGVLAVIATGMIILWAVVTGRTVSQDRAAENARLQFELTRADMCANAAILSMAPQDRSSERVQAIVNDCLAQVQLPFVRINVPEGE